MKKLRNLFIDAEFFHCFSVIVHRSLFEFQQTDYQLK